MKIRTSNTTSHPLDWLDLLYFAVHNVHLFAQIFEGKIRMHILHGYNVTYHGYNNPMYEAHKTVGAHYTQQNMVKDRQVLESCGETETLVHC